MGIGSPSNISLLKDVYRKLLFVCISSIVHRKFLLSILLLCIIEFINGGKSIFHVYKWMLKLGFLCWYTKQSLTENSVASNNVWDAIFHKFPCNSQGSYECDKHEYDTAEPWLLVPHKWSYVDSAINYISSSKPLNT